MNKKLNIYQYSCPACGFTLYSESNSEEIHCHLKTCNFKDPLHIKNYIETCIEQDSQFYSVSESFMVDHGCHEVRSILKGTEVEVIKIVKDYFLVETLDGFNFFAPRNRFIRKK